MCFICNSYSCDIDVVFLKYDIVFEKLCAVFFYTIILQVLNSCLWPTRKKRKHNFQAKLPCPFLAPYFNYFIVLEYATRKFLGTKIQRRKQIRYLVMELHNNTS